MLKSSIFKYVQQNIKYVTIYIYTRTHVYKIIVDVRSDVCVKSVWSCNVSTTCWAVNLNIMSHIVHYWVCIWFIFGKHILMSWLYSILHTRVSWEYNVGTVDHPFIDWL